MKPAICVQIVLTLIFVFTATSRVQAAAKSIETVELRVTNFFGSDGYVELEAVDPKGSVGNSKVSLRCVERAYDGKIAWTYQELMVLDPKGPEIKRKEPRGNVAKENGYSFVFGSFEECEKASPKVLDGSAECRMRVAIDKTPIKRKSEKIAKGTARLISADCVSPSKSH
ncbi:hypothetical protein BH10BDE1_BH10BDE1_28510 [soil metagenome]